jgi:predicted TIM-barrel fold metal-dependent hydrolase
MRRPRALVRAAAAVLVLAVRPPAAAPVDQELLERIAAIRAVDDQMHPQVVGAEGGVDREWHAVFPHETLVESLHAPLPARLRPGTPELARAWRALYGYRWDDVAPHHLREGLDAKRRTQLSQGEAYPAWVLDRLGIDVALANRMRLGAGVNPPRFRWVAFADPLVFPLGTPPGGDGTPERRAFYAAVDRGRRELIGGTPPGTLPEYLEEVVSPTLARLQQQGAVAVKLEAVYLQRADWVAADEFDARAIYAKYAWGAEPPPVEYEALQAFLVRYLAVEASRLGMALHVHTGSDLGAAVGLRGVRPTLLGWLLDDAQVGWTNVVLVQGGWPFTAEVAALLAKPNVYADLAAQAYALSPSLLAATLRPWLELYPEKVLFGTGALPLTSELGWEETAWIGVQNARRALAIALGAMVDDGLVSRTRALEIARMVLRDNAVALYRLAP